MAALEEDAAFRTVEDQNTPEAYRASVTGDCLPRPHPAHRGKFRRRPGQMAGVVGADRRTPSIAVGMAVARLAAVLKRAFGNRF